MIFTAVSSNRIFLFIKNIRTFHTFPRVTWSSSCRSFPSDNRYSSCNDELLRAVQDGGELHLFDQDGWELHLAVEDGDELHLAVQDDEELHLADQDDDELHLAVHDIEILQHHVQNNPGLLYKMVIIIVIQNNQNTD